MVDVSGYFEISAFEIKREDFDWYLLKKYLTSYVNRTDSDQSADPCIIANILFSHDMPYCKDFRYWDNPIAEQAMYIQRSCPKHSDQDLLSFHLVNSFVQILLMGHVDFSEFKHWKIL